MFFAMLPTVYALCALVFSATALNTPFHTEGRWIVDSAGSNFTYIGANWAGAGEAMIPEGLQYQSIETHVSRLKSLGFNSIRLTFAIQMIDDIIDGGDKTIQDSLINALGAENGARVWEQVQRANPAFTPSTTRLQAFDAIASECAKQSISVHLDNHMSSAEWCCDPRNGNSWFGDHKFNVANWKRGLEFMVRHAAAWPTFTSIGLRNELRLPLSFPPASTLEWYTWPVWYSNMIAAAQVVHAANPDTLIFLGGINWATDLTPIPEGIPLGDGNRFDLQSFEPGFREKLVLELHNYQNDAGDCGALKFGMWLGGFRALSSMINQMPVILSEFGFSQDEGGVGSAYATCIRDYISEELKTGWFVWLFGGGYYTREGTQDSDDSWGLLNHDWSGLRHEGVFNEVVGKMISNSQV